MEFGLFMELSVPRPWTADSERTSYANALEQVRIDKRRESSDGSDGTWVAHPGLVPLAREIFDRGMPGPHQIARRPAGAESAATSELLGVPEGPITEGGLRQNINVGILYLAAWLRGSGCVPLYDLMEDAATAEISRTQVWQWLRHGARLEDGRPISLDLYRAVRDEEISGIRRQVGDETWNAGRYARAAEIFDDLATASDLADFLTIPAYDELLRNE